MEGIRMAKGWAFLTGSKKAHYFNDDMFSLCRKYGFYFGEADDTNDDHKDNCAECVKKKKKLNNKVNQAIQHTES
jgi:hypothetical protein